jgi:membrane-associated protease RseP (regulator of RpoE activity)
LVPFIAAADRVAETQAALMALRAEDLRVATVAYRIAVSNRMLCPRVSPWLGIVVHDLRQYAPAYRAMVSSAYDLAGGPAIEAVVPEGAAERAGAHQGDRIRAINGAPVEDRAPVMGEAADYSGVETVLAQLDAAALLGPVRLTVDRSSGPVTYDVTAESGCQSKVQLETSKSPNASADGTMISIGLEAAAAATTVDELAVSIGHEMAHNILEHRARLDRERVSRGFWQNFGRNAREIRKTEDEADLLGLYLMARAGFDIDVAPAYWERIASEAGSDATHASARERRAITQRIVDDIKSKQQRGEALIPPLTIPGRSQH